MDDARWSLNFVIGGAHVRRAVPVRTSPSAPALAALLNVGALSLLGPRSERGIGVRQPVCFCGVPDVGVGVLLPAAWPRMSRVPALVDPVFLRRLICCASSYRCSDRRVPEERAGFFPLLGFRVVGQLCFARQKFRAWGLPCVSPRSTVSNKAVRSVV